MRSGYFRSDAATPLLKILQWLPILLWVNKSQCSHNDLHGPTSRGPSLPYSPHVLLTTSALAPSFSATPASSSLFEKSGTLLSQGIRYSLCLECPSFQISAWSTLFGSLPKCHLPSKPFIVTLSKIRCFHFSVSLLCFTFWHIISYNTLFIYIVYYLSPPVEFKLHKGRNLFFFFMFGILAHISAQ